MKKDTEKITVSLPRETLRIADENRERFGYTTRSDFINSAIREYISRDLLKEFSGELAQFYRRIDKSEIKVLEEHLSKLSYKIAVEIAQMNLLFASIYPLEQGDFRRLRGKAVQLVNRSRGYVPMKEASQHQIELINEDEDEGDFAGYF